mgnify:CR=1 FL=1
MPQDFYTILWSIVGLIGTGLATWLTSVIVGWLNQKIKDKKIARWSTALFEIVMRAVQTIFQEFVETLKNDGKFTPAAQKEAKDKAYNVIVSQLTPELTKYITDNFGDMKEYLFNQIEAMIYQLKNSNKEKF